MKTFKKILGWLIILGIIAAGFIFAGIRMGWDAFLPAVADFLIFVGVLTTISFLIIMAIGLIKGKL